MVKNTDEATALRRLGTMLRGVRVDYKVAKDVADGAADAAAKCQVTVVVVDPKRGCLVSGTRGQRRKNKKANACK